MSKKKKSQIKGQKLSQKQLKKEIIRLFRRQPKKQMNPRQVLKKLKVANNKDAVQHTLNQLVESGSLVAKDQFRYMISEQAARSSNRNGQFAEGRMDMTRTGAGYVIVDGMEDDIFVAPRYMNTALNGDRVKIRYWKARGRHKPEGEVVEVIKRSADQFVGILSILPRFGLVALEGSTPLEIMVELDQLNGAEEGNLVVVKMTQWSAGRYNYPVGEITTVLGTPGTSNIEMQAILINKGFNITFPEEVVRESEALPETISEEEIAKRRDFRDTLTFTIDPLDAKDFDDAISIHHLDDGGLEVGVHIADVSHYVKPNSALDEEAYRRSTSVYLVDRVCPMLPERISNGLCSLRPKEDKLTFSAVFVMDQNFKITSRWFGKGIIHSDRRFTYEEAQEEIETGKGDYPTEIRLLNSIAKKYRANRFRRGSIDFDSEEVRFRLDEDGTPIEVYVKERFDAHMLVEEFMLLANREVATYITRKEKARNTKIPFVYRVHDEPDPEKVAELATFAQAMGFEMDISSPTTIAKSYNRLMKQAETDHGLKILAPLAIRTMAKAIYTSENIGHYGLGFANYTHFTSPIRRYSDVLVHRILEPNLVRGSLHQVNGVKLEEKCKHISGQERKATEAERESIKYKQVEYMEKHVGEEFAGVVNGIADFGIFVELVDSHCEGMISFDHMDQAYEMGSGRLSVRGLQNGQVIRMGDDVRVRILETDLKRRRIEMALVEGPKREAEVVTSGKTRKGKPRPKRRTSNTQKSRRNARRK